MSTLKRELNPTGTGTGTARLGVAAAVALAALVLSPLSQAAEQAPGLRVVKDPVTGQLRAPTADEAAALGKAANAKTTQPRGLLTGKVNPQPILHKDGTVEQELDESSLSYSVATRGADGATELYCVTGPQAAANVMSGKKTGARIEKIGKEHDHDVK